MQPFILHRSSVWKLLCLLKHNKEWLQHSSVGGVVTTDFTTILLYMTVWMFEVKQPLLTDSFNLFDLVSLATLISTLCVTINRVREQRASDCLILLNAAALLFVWWKEENFNTLCGISSACLTHCCIVFLPGWERSSRFSASPFVSAT